jgi:hypothetical protein
MKCIINRIALLGIIVFATLILCSSAYAQRDTVQAALSIQMYDVVFITDFIDILKQELLPNVAGMSLYLTSKRDGLPVDRWVCIYIEVRIQLRGESEKELIRAYTNNFKVIGTRELSAKEFSGVGSSEIFIRDGSGNYWEDKDLRKRLEDMAAKNPTAPPGSYAVHMEVLPATSENPHDRAVPSRSVILGGDEKRFTVQYSAADEVFVEITDPKNGSVFNNLAPTISWTSGAPVKVSVYEALPTHRSPQDALSGGNPCLVRNSYGDVPDFVGTSLTYPPDAQRQLQQNKAYVILVEGRVLTNRNEIFRPSIPFVFRISDDKVGQMLDNFLSAFSGSASATYSTLREEPSNWIAWSPYGGMTIDGSTITETDLQTLLNELSQKTEITLQLGVENQ